jgi:ArsR family transcriptional regulator, arsenate/arsenite/antimonite-responsive transcriptional repressor
MNANKSKTEEQLALFYKALGHPARLQILNTMVNCQPCSCKDFVNALPWSQSTISEHLNKLKKAGLISFTTKGVDPEYSLNQKKFEHYLKLHYQYTQKQVASFFQPPVLYTKLNYNDIK